MHKRSKNYRIHLKQVAAKRDVYKVEVAKKEEKLASKKDKLFKQQDMSQWDVDEEIKKLYTPIHLTQDKQLAFQYMLPKVF